MKKIYIVMSKEECADSIQIESCKAFQTKKQAVAFIKILKLLFKNEEIKFYVEACNFEFKKS
jgi:hypothetical protein